MNRSRLALALALPALVLSFGLLRSAQGAADAPKPVAQIKHIMLTVNGGPTSIVTQLREAIDSASLDDEGWELANARATMVMEAANLLYGMKPPRGGDDVAKWQGHVMAYRGCADAAREATAKKDQAAAKAAIVQLQKKCKECHADHQKQE
jgi:hypothetical protein